MANPDAFAQVVKVIKHTELSDAKAQLIPFECYSLDSPLCLGAWPWNPWF